MCSPDQTQAAFWKPPLTDPRMIRAFRFQKRRREPESSTVKKDWNAVFGCKRASGTSPLPSRVWGHQDPFDPSVHLSGVRKRVVSKRVVLADVPPERKPERGHVRQNHPFTKPPFCLPMTLFSVDKRVVSKRVVSADVPPERKPERGHVRQNHPFTKPPFYLPVNLPWTPRVGRRCWGGTCSPQASMSAVQSTEDFRAATFQACILIRETLCESGRCIDALKERRRALKKRGRVLKRGEGRWAASSEGGGWLLKKGGRS